jgi:hypothetical protein
MSIPRSDMGLEGAVRYWTEIAENPAMHQRYLVWKDQIVAAPVCFSPHEMVKLQRLILGISKLLFGLTAIRFGGSVREHGEALRFAEPEIVFQESFKEIETNPCVIARPDCIVRAGVPKVLEFNVGGNVGGIASTDMHGAKLLKNYFDNSAQQSRIVFEPVVAELVRLYQRLSGRARPHVLLLEWRDKVGTDSPAGSVDLLRELIAEAGLECSVADPREVGFANKLCMFGGKQIDVAHRFFAWSLDDLQPGGRLPPEWISAVRSQTLPFVGWRTSKLWGSKANIALLSEMLEMREYEDFHAVINLTVPWTRKIREGWASFSGRKVDLLDHARREQAQLVLKKSSGTDDGRDVIVGRNVTATQWEQHLSAALLSDWIVQAYVEPTCAVFPVVDVGCQTLEPTSLYYVVSPYVIDTSRVVGGWVRGQPSDGPTHIQYGNVLTTCIAIREHPEALV